MVMISETVVTSSQSIVQSLDINQVSPLYIKQLTPFLDDYLRLNFPLDYTIRLGCNLRPFLFCHRVEDELWFCMNQLPIINQKTVKGFFYKENGFPRSQDLDAGEDAMFFVVPRYLSPFSEGDHIVYEYVPETEPDTERMIKCRKL